MTTILLPGVPQDFYIWEIWVTGTGAVCLPDPVSPGTRNVGFMMGAALTNYDMKPQIPYNIKMWQNMECFKQDDTTIWKGIVSEDFGGTVIFMNLDDAGIPYYKIKFSNLYTCPDTWVSAGGNDYRWYGTITIDGVNIKAGDAIDIEGVGYTDDILVSQDNCHLARIAAEYSAYMSDAVDTGIGGPEYFSSRTIWTTLRRLWNNPSNPFLQNMF